MLICVKRYAETVSSSMNEWGLLGVTLWELHVGEVSPPEEQCEQDPTTVLLTRKAPGLLLSLTSACSASLDHCAWGAQPHHVLC
jgi:hypothetical protein